MQVKDENKCGQSFFDSFRTSTSQGIIWLELLGLKS